MSGKFKENFNFYTNILFLLFIICGSIFAVGFHSANEILSGTFLGNYNFAGNLTHQGNHISSYGGFKNLIINGDLRLNQRNYDNSPILDNYSYDRFLTIGSSSIAIDKTITGTVIQYIENDDGYLDGLNLTVSNGETKISLITIEEYDGTPISIDSKGTFTVPSGTSHIGIKLINSKIDNLQVEMGNYPTPFERRPYGMELSLAMRYYEKSPIETGSDYSTETSQSYFWFNFIFKVPKRITPLMYFYNGRYITNPSGSSSEIITSYFNYGIDKLGGRIRANAVTDGVEAYGAAFDWNADAEIY